MCGITLNAICLVNFLGSTVSPIGMNMLAALLEQFVHAFLARAAETDWYVATTTRVILARHHAAASARDHELRGRAIGVGDDIARACTRRLASGFTSGTTSGTSGSMRYSDELSITTQPWLAAFGA